LGLAQYGLPKDGSDDHEDAQAPLVEDTPAETARPVMASTEPESPPEGIPIQTAANAFASGDSRLLAGDIVEALKEYEILLAHAPDGMSDPLRYRIALCAESLGDSDRAMKEYQRLASHGSVSRIGVAAQIGQARVWHESNRALPARRVIWNLLLADRSNEGISVDLRAECVHRLGQLLARRTIGPPSNDLASDSTIVDLPLRWSTREALLWIMSDPEESQPVEPEETEAEDLEGTAIQLTQQLGPKAEETYLTVNLPQMPVAGVIELLAEQAHLEVDWSTAARDRVSEHTVQLAVQDITLAIILDGISDSMELVWVDSDDGVRLQARDDVDADAVRRFDFAVAERMLRRATTVFPEHELTDDAYGALGNIGVRRDQFDFARLQYEQLLRQFPQSDARVGVQFNLAKARLRMGDRDEAMEHFYHVVDEGVGDRLQPVAFLYIGRLYLENDQAKRAIRPLTRAVLHAPDDDLRATSVIALASAYLLLDNPHAANRVLMTHRTALGKTPHYDQAAFLAALSRHKAAVAPAQVAREGQSLIGALSHVEGTDFFAACGFVLVAEACKRLGLFEPMRSTLVQGIENPDLGELRARMLYALAEYYHDAGEVMACRKLLTSLAIHGEGEWGDQAKLRLADAMYAAGEDEQCLSMCRKLLETTAKAAEERDVLRIMGRVFERQGSHREAALCFAGIVPTTRNSRQQGAIR